MRPPARLDVPLRDLDDPELTSRDDPALVQSEPVLRLRDVPGEGPDPHGRVREDDLVREPLDPVHLVVGERVVVGDVEAGEVRGLVGSRLPHVVP